MRSSIVKKLISSNVIIIVCVFTIVLAVVSFISYRTNEKNLKNTEKQIRSSLLAKGQTLIVNNSRAMRGMASDNAIMDVKDLVSSTVKNDDDLIYGIYMQQDRKPWVVAKKEDRGGSNAGFESLNDSISIWASTLKTPSYCSVRYNNEDIIEFASPVIVDDEIQGFIRYGITTQSMKRLLASAQASARRSFIGILLFLLIVAAGAIAGAFTATRQQAVRITTPIKSLVASAQQIAGGNYSCEIRPETDDEIGVLSTTFEKMRQTVKKYTERLQEIVDEKMQQVRDIMNNIDQGLFTINLDLTVNPEYSARANAILGFQDIAAQSLESLFRLDGAGMDAMRNWITLVKEKHASQRWAKLARLAPIQELEIPTAPEPRYVRVIFQKILAKDDSLCKIMALCHDVTESRRIERRMEAERLRHENEVKTILGIVGNPPEIISDFITDTTSRLQRIEKSIEQMHADVARQRRDFPEGKKIEFSQELLLTLYRDLHTIKGNAGTYGFDLLSTHSHEAENLLEDLKEPARTRRTDTLESFKRHLTEMSLAMDEIRKNIRKLSGEQDEVVLRVAKSKIGHIHNLCDAIASNKRVPDDFEKLISACRRLNFITVAQLTKKYKDLIKRIGEKTEKNVCFELTNPSYEVAPESFEDIDEAVVHIIRNAIDHGIEPIYERERCGKGIGKIVLDFRTTDEGRELIVSDNGRGIDTKKLVDKALQKGLVTRNAVEAMTEQEKNRLIFLPGLSTAEQVSSISGRGVGMDIVNSVVSKLNGNITVESVPGQGTTISMQFPLLSGSSRTKVQERFRGDETRMDSFESGAAIKNYGINPTAGDAVV